MRAILFPQYGSPDVLRLTEVAKSTPNENQILVKVYAARGQPPGLASMRGEPFLARIGEGYFQPKPQTRSRHRRAGRSGGQKCDGV